MFHCNYRHDGASKRALVLTLALIVFAPLAQAAKKGVDSGTAPTPSATGKHNELWREPTDIAFRDLLYGPGGRENEPPGKFTFVKEDLDGTNPKFEVRDEAGVKWKIKLGVEAKPETAAARLVWAAGYFTKELYFLREVQVDGMPSHVKRGQELIGPGGLLHDARMERNLKDRKKAGQWQWRRNPFTGTPEFNGLRVMMALINNWDVKDQNTAIYDETSGGSLESSRRIYMVSDLGASFGTTGQSWTHALSKGNLKSFHNTKLIKQITPAYVDFNVPTRPAIIYFFSLPSFITRVRMRWIGKHIPRADAKRAGEILSQLSPGQIRDAFRAAGFSPDEVEGFARIVEERIAELNKL